MALGQIRIVLDVDNSGAITGTMQTIGALRSLGTAATAAGGAMDRAQQHHMSFFKTLRDGVMILGLARHAIQNLHAVTTEWMYGIIKTGAQLERFQVMLEGMSNASTKAARQLEAESQFAWIRDLSTRAPFALSALGDSFVKLKSVGIDPTNGSMEALIDSVARFGGNNETLKRATVAIQQMAGKGVISMEELRQQLGEAVPNAINLMAHAMNMSYMDFVKTVSLGRVESSTALKLMFNEMERTFGGSAEKLMHTWDGLIARLSTAWTNFVEAINKSGYFNEAKRQLSDLIGLLTTGRAMNFADTIGKGLTTLIQWTRQAIEIVDRFGGSIIRIAGWAAGTLVAIRGLAAAFAGLQVIASAATAIRTFVAGLGSANLAAVTFRGVLSSIAVGTGAVTTAGAAASGTIGLFGRALAGLAGPIGIAVALVWTLIEAFDLLGTHAKAASEEIRNNPYVSQQTIDDAKSRLEDLESFIKQKQQVLANPTVRDGSNYRAETEAQVNSALAEASRLRKDIQAAEELNYKQSIDRISSYRMDKELEFLENIRANRNTARDMLVQQAQEGKWSQEKYFDERRELDRKFYSQQLAALGVHLLAKQALLLFASGQEKDIIKAQIAAYKEQMNEVKEGLTRLNEETLGKFIEPDDTKTAAKEINRLEQALDSARGRVAELKAEIAGQNGLAAKFTELAKNGYYGTHVDPKKLQELIQLQTQIENLTKAKAEYDKAQDKSASATEWLSDKNKELSDRYNELAQTVADPDRILTPASIIRQRTELEEKLNDALAFTGVSLEDRAAAILNYTTALNNLDANVVLEAVTGYQEKTRALENSLLTEDQLKQAEYDRDVQIAMQKIDLTKLTGEERKNAEDALYSYLEARQAKFARDTEGPMRTILRNWSDVNKQLEQAGSQWLSSFGDELSEFVTTGKFKFKDFVDSVIKDLARIATQKLLSGLFEWGMGKLTGGDLNGAIDGMIDSNPDIFHSGGMVGSAAPSRLAPASIFAGAPRFHTGGLPGLRSNEVPIIAEKGEGIFTKEQMAAMGGGGAKPSVHINIINQSGQNVTAEQGDSRFDGKKFVLDMVLSATSKPGAFRDALKTNLRN